MPCKKGSVTSQLVGGWALDASWGWDRCSWLSDPAWCCLAPRTAMLEPSPSSTAPASSPFRTVFKGTLLAPSLRGKVGSAMVPGGTVGYSGSVAGAISPEYQQAAFNYLELATATNFSWQTVLDPTSIWAPLRDSMISGPNALQPYLAAGYDLATTKEWLSVTKATLSGGNSVSAAGLPNPDAYQSFMEAAAHNITYSSLWATANMSRSGWTDNVTLVLQALDAQVKPPGAGPETTLVLTDIESSTLLFETMPQGLMDCVMKCHHTTVRAVSLRNNGYEWSTEGDSFLIAFHTAVDALLTRGTAYITVASVELASAGG
ncbi:guanylate cyclase domain-containing protein [Haematococcus lacustris]|uniref:Guanylate cyclase domain-containing protein n=1 Tax=Haematococcus lacustris TaxID=44745 RepID=A0A699YQN6_HAELA|nr:guanylate cyclase domain-containing protein [Haematococcus lacustris]